MQLRSLIVLAFVGAAFVAGGIAIYIASATVRVPIVSPDKPSDAFMALAAQGDVAAQIDLAAKFESGRGVPKDLAQAEAWYRRAVAGGGPVEQRQFACFLYRTADGGAARRMVFAEMKKAADAGDYEAVLHLARYHRFGYGTPRDEARADGYLRDVVNSLLDTYGVEASGPLEKVQDTLRTTACAPADETDLKPFYERPKLPVQML